MNGKARPVEWKQRPIKRISRHIDTNENTTPKYLNASSVTTITWYWSMFNLSKRAERLRNKKAAEGLKIMPNRLV
jgi:hypothetical protein